MPSKITKLLSRIDSPGTFATRLQASPDALAISVIGVGTIPLPLVASTVKKLRAIAQPSPFGLGERTLHDNKVRNSWEIPGSRVKIGTRQFRKALHAYLQTLRDELGFPEDSDLEATLDKLLIYEKGQFFKPHQDSEKQDNMVATLVVILPSEYRGGTVTVEHQGETKRFRRCTSQSKDLSLLAFYADCCHAVSAITSGARVVLTYRLTLNNARQAVLPLSQATLLDDLTKALERYFAEPVTIPYSKGKPAPPQRFVYLLDHQYTQHSLTWSRLKNVDHWRVSALRSVSERLDCECFLAQADVHESWMCEEDDDYARGGYGRGDYGWPNRYIDDYDTYDDDDDDDDDDDADQNDLDGADDDLELIELIESSVNLNHWLDATGQHIDGIDAIVEGHELHFTYASQALTPYDIEHEGYQGNYGNTVDRWYKRAAFVMWPKASTFALRAEASPQWAVDQLLALPGNQTAELQTLVKRLLPRWQWTAGQVQAKSFFTKLMKVALRLDDPKLTSAWLAPVRQRMIDNTAMRRDLISLINRHGFAWAKTVLTAWMNYEPWETPPWLPLLVDVCTELHADKRAPAKALATWLIEQQLKHALANCVEAHKERQPWLALRTFPEEAKQLTHVLAAAVAIAEHKAVDDTIKLLLSQRKSGSTAFLTQLLQTSLAGSPALRSYIRQSPLQYACVERLQALLATPARAKDDWRIDYALDCHCADCKVLGRFLKSKETAHDWPLNEDRRRHIHDMLKSAQLPVQHKTLRSGRPFLLQLRKMKTLFEREQAFKEELTKVLRTLQKSRTR